MGFLSGVKKAAGKVFDVRVDRWMSFSALKENTQNTKSLIKDVFTPEKAQRKETFEQAMARLKLSEADLAQRKKEFTHLFSFFLILGLSIVGYAIYMAFTARYMVSFISLCVALYAFAQSFRFHFWLFQIKNRKLGCTIQEWFHSKILTPSESAKLPAKRPKK
ncbi:MAG: type IVB secretion system protein IcmV [Gammaproteobacteria bacterium]